jgi:hypothetical protein
MGNCGLVLLRVAMKCPFQVEIAPLAALQWFEPALSDCGVKFGVGS